MNPSLPMVASATPATATGLLSVAFTHEYYGGSFTTFAAQPLPATAKTCRQLGLGLVRDAAGLTLAIAVDALRSVKTADYRAALAATTLCWQLNPRPRDFAAGTAVDFTSNSACLVFTAAYSAQGGSLTVAATASAKDVWPRQALHYDFRPAHALKVGAALRLENGAGGLLRTLKVTDPNLVALDTSDFGSGPYQLAQGSQVLVKWFADERPFPPASSGGVLVLPGALLAAAFTAALKPGATPPVYTAAYAARSVIWRYHIFNTQADDTLSIVPYTGGGLPCSADADALVPDAPVEPARTSRSRSHQKPAAAARPVFKPFTDPALPGAKSFAAVQPLKLVKQPAQCFALNNGATSLYAPLPVAGVDFARAAGQATLCSDIFVYL